MFLNIYLDYCLHPWNETGYVFTDVCLSVRLLDWSKSWEGILMRVLGRVEHGLRSMWLVLDRWLSVVN